MELYLSVVSFYLDFYYYLCNGRRFHVRCTSRRRYFPAPLICIFSYALLFIRMNRVKLECYSRNLKFLK